VAASSPKDLGMVGMLWAFVYKPLLFCGGRGEGREKQGQKTKKSYLSNYTIFPRQVNKKLPKLTA
jgi:hypothetical protein